MSHRLAMSTLVLPTVFAVLAGVAGPALAQNDPQLVGVSVAGTVVEIPVDVAAEACGVDAETLLADWEALGIEMSTMADTSVTADATDLAPAVEADTAMDAAIDGESPADGADATNSETGDVAADVNSDATEGANMAGDGTENAASSDLATPVEGTDLSKAAVCEVSQGTADGLGIAVPG